MKIIQGLEKKYEKYVEINKKDEYSKAIIKAGEIFGNALDEGKNPEEAEIIMCDADLGLTGFMVGSLMSAIVHFHPRGKEVNKWWNKKWGGTEMEGTINPAILTIK